MNSSASLCPKCGAPLPATATEGLCPRCLLAQLGDFSPLPWMETETKGEADEAIPVREGSEFGDYELLEEIGQGGMGVVYRARQVSLNRPVAVKVIKLGMDTRSVLARFEAERRALALMDHPNIAKVLDAGTSDTGRPYFVMELVSGIRITDYCNRHRLSTRQRLELFIQVCQAVQHAHQKGVVHRDLKPSNILVGELDGKPVPKIIDFGIAKAVEGRLADQTLFTAFEQFLGTPAYVSPEQATLTAVDVDTRSDIYSLGVLLYELLTGHTPFDTKALLASGLDELRRTIREVQPVRPSTRLRETRPADTASGSLPAGRQAALASDLDWIVMKCLEKDRQRRYETANGLAMDLQRHLNHEPIVARPPSRLYEFQKTVKRHKFGFVATATVILVLAAGLAGVLWQWRRAVAAQRTAEQERDRAAANLYAADMLLAQRAWEESNLGRTLELLNKHRPVPNHKDYRGWEWRYLWRLCQSDELFTLGRLTNHVFGVAYSPDGRHAATAGAEATLQGELRIWDLTTGRIIESPANENASSPAVCVGSVAYSADGNLLAYGTAHRGVKVWSTVLKQEIASFPVQQPFLSGGRLAFVPNQHVLAAGDDRGLITCWDIETSSKVGTFAGHGASVSWLAFAPDGRTLASTDRAGNLSLWDMATQKELTILTNQASNVNTVAFAPNGRLLASGGWDGTVRVWSIPDLRQLMVRTNHASWVSSVVFSPDGRTLASAGADQTIRLWDTTNWEEIRTLRGHTDEVSAMDFAPDGQRLLSGAKDGEIKVWPAAAERNEPDVLTIPSDAPLQALANDGSALALFHTNRTVSVWSLPELHEATRFPIPDAIESIHAVEISPAGGSVAYSSTDGWVKLWDTKAGGMIRQTKLTGASNLTLCFSFDGKILAGGGGGAEITLWDAKSLRQAKSLLRSEVGPIKQMAFCWDNRSLAVGSLNGNVEVWDLAQGSSVLVETHSALTGVALMPDRRTLVTSDLNAKLKLWDLETRQEKATLGRTLNAFFSLALSPDGNRIAAGAWNGPVGLWDPETGHEIITLSRTETDQSLAFLPDGNGLVALGETSVKIWQAPSWEEIEAAERAAGSSELLKPSN